MQSRPLDRQSRLTLLWSIAAARALQTWEQSEAREERNKALAAILRRLEQARADAELVSRTRRETARELS